MSLTPGKDHAVQILHGTIYEKVTDATYTYHMHAAISAEALLANNVWTIWREHTANGNITCPSDGDEPTPDGNIGTNPAGLTYWATV